MSDTGNSCKRSLHSDILRFEEISNNAWPALQSVQYDGWILRFANGVTKRSNSVNMLYPSALDPEKKISYCEDLYRARNIPICFKLTDIADPADMDRRLEFRQYFIHAVLSFQVLNLQDRIFIVPPAVEFTRPGDPEWLDQFIGMNRFDPERKETYQRIMEGVVTPLCLARIQEEGKTVAVGMCVLEDKYVGLFDIVTDPDFRKRGYGSIITQSLMAWGNKNGATLAYLQVLVNNLPALQLYRQLGFKELYRYWYRVRKE